MAKIRNSKPKNSSNAYERVFNNKKLGELLTKVQSTVISAGTELEKIIFKDNILEIGGFDLFIEKCKNNDIEDKIYIASKKTLKNSKYKIKYFDSSSNREREDQPDSLVFVIKNKECLIIELKEGFSFDTKKSLSEYQMLKKAKEILGSGIPFSTKFYLCSFNSENKKEIYYGLKKKFSIDEILTGKELCELLEINYFKIIENRKIDCNDNLNYFIDEMLKIDEIKTKIIEKLK